MLLRSSIPRTRAELLTFGPVDLIVTDRVRSLSFWRDLIGLQVIADNDDSISLGAESDVLVVLHRGAVTPLRNRYSALPLASASSTRRTGAYAGPIDRVAMADQPHRPHRG